MTWLALLAFYAPLANFAMLVWLAITIFRADGHARHPTPCDGEELRPC